RCGIDGELGNSVGLGCLESPFEAPDILSVMAVNEFDSLAGVMGAAAAEADDAVKFAGGQCLGACHYFKVLGVGGYFIKHLGVNPGSLQHALDCLDNAGAFQAGGYDQSIGHPQCSGIITNHCMCAPTDIYGWISVHHLDRVFK